MWKETNEGLEAEFEFEDFEDWFEDKRDAVRTLGNEFEFEDFEDWFEDKRDAAKTLQGMRKTTDLL